MKKLFSFLLAFAMLLSMAAICPQTVDAAVSYTPTATETGGLCSCGCGQVLDAVQWKPWNPNLTGSAPLSGHYYLDADYIHAKQYQINSGVRVVIDLRGHKLSTTTSRLFLVYGYLAVIDSVGGGLLSAHASGTANGGAVMIAWDAVAMNDEKDATLELFDCTATLEHGTSGLNGGLFHLGNSCTLNINRCKLISASALKHAGAIYASGNSKVTLTDMEIYDCSAATAGGAIYANGTLTLQNCILSGNKAESYGGAIYKNGSSLTMTNTTLQNNISHASQYGGGNLYATGSTVNMTSCTLRGGYAAANGGNLYLNSGSCSMISCTVTGGIAANQGGNLYAGNSVTSMSLNSCTFSGDAYFAGKKLTLKNKTNIAINNTGLVLGSSTQLMDSDLTGTVCKGADLCPHCDQQVTWTPIGDTPSGHCYLTADLARTAAYQITADTVIDLRGFDITSSDRAFTIASAGKLTILDSAGGSTVTGSGNTDGAGGVYKNAGELTLRGGKHIYAAGTAAVLTGGVVHNDNILTITGGVLDGSAFQSTNTASAGGTVYHSDGTRSFTISAGYLLGGSVYKGGTLRIGSNNRFDMTGGIFSGGTAGYIAGNVMISGATGKHSRGVMRNLLISDGVSNGSSGAGNLFVGYCAPDLIDSLILNGSAPTAYGGNVSVGTNGDLRSWRTTVLGGTAPRGGNFYSSSYLSAAVLTNCRFLLGHATTGNGGNLFVNHGNIKLTGGQVSYGTAAAFGGNIYNNGGNYSHASATDDGLFLEGSILLSCGKAESGGNLYSQGNASLTSCRFVNGQATLGSDIYYNKGTNACSLTIGESMTGSASIYVAPSLMGSSTYGGTIHNTAATTLNAAILLEGQAGTPLLCVQNGQLCVGGVSVKTATTEVWHPTVASAIDACPENGWVKLYVDSEVVLTKDCVIDLNGRIATVSGDYALYGMDSSGNDFSVPTGKAVWEGAPKTAAMTEAGNNRYISITEGSAATYHRLAMELTDVTLRTESCGIYYKGSWGCDSILAPYISGYGIAVSVYAAPGADFATTDGCMYSSYDGSTLENGEIKTGMLIKNIMKDNLRSGNNQRRGETPIYATAYVTLTDGTVITAGNTAYSLRSAMEKMDRLVTEQPGLYLRDAVWTVRDFYTKWENKGMENWNFTKLKQPEDDGVLKIIILGSSRSVNTFQLLYQAFKDQMPEQEFVMGVMYYSGCSMTMHENFIKTNQAVYHYYRNDGSNWVITPGMKMEEGLHAENWDIVLLQAGTGDTSKNMQLETRKFLKGFIDDHLVDPYDLWWHTTWFNSTDPDLYKPPKTAADAAAVDKVAQLTTSHNAAINYVLDDPMFAGHITSGTPMLYALKGLGLQDKDLFRDHTHLSDFGCLLVAYAFYAQYTGNPVTEIKIDTIPVSLRHKDYQHLGDMTVTDEMKQVIIDTVAYTLANPWSIPTGQ